jgi:hypothetical protein
MKNVHHKKLASMESVQIHAKLQVHVCKMTKNAKCKIISQFVSKFASVKSNQIALAKRFAMDVIA